MNGFNLGEASTGIPSLAKSPKASRNSDLLSTLNVPDRTKFEYQFEFDTKAEETYGEIVEDSKSNQEDVETTEDLFKNFEDWLIKNGAEFPDLYLKNYGNDVRGVHSKRSIDSYVCIVSIPEKCLITDFMGRTETAIGRKLFSEKCSLSTPNLMAVILYILTTRDDPNNFFQPYYKILPKSYSNFPIFWGEDKLAWLEGSPLIDDIIERKRNMRADYDEVCRVCPEFTRYSFEEFLEVRTAVGSRNFGIVINGEKRTAMVPYSDMLNHFRPRETSWTFENSRNAFTITSISPLQAGQQVMDSYGKKCNSKFFLHYGFAVECNREEDGRCQNELLYRMSFTDAANDPLRETRLTFLGSSRATRGFRVSMNIEDKATAEALSYLRFKVADKNELNALITRHSVPRSTGSIHARGGRDAIIPFVSPRNEANALAQMAEYSRRQLNRYPQSREGNLAVLNSGNVAPFTDRRTALVVVLSEQEICHFWINAAYTLCPILKEKSGLALRVALRSLPETTEAEKDLYRYAATIAEEVGKTLTPWEKQECINSSKLI
mmetsp:Transcript_1022/g.1336  ORF Transcript_1022/g.1336 Transcript_1022/m.1336 type:complete len:549 (+) Transcript_1022:393-2039(+)|eukprot:CAMPEP_0204832264 /NCGR_PEP_ID=MMETSP1346-20131115/12982_1 /ASSEMBLY_ACC=CAM_ASM_000771 /TAXON_ID=215587 /ORGANISM="Aplanochytrium stocchinoi, Strain GSBS06" /LENGTH=548 /DNA_ID=CAMNT_0051963933 /DNA_START=270 /DNA_END=1916 /DNA_ORIENTATION=+